MRKVASMVSFGRRTKREKAAAADGQSARDSDAGSVSPGSRTASASQPVAPADSKLSRWSRLRGSARRDPPASPASPLPSANTRSGGGEAAEGAAAAHFSPGSPPTSPAAPQRPAASPEAVAMQQLLQNGMFGRADRLKRAAEPGFGYVALYAYSTYRRDHTLVKKYTGYYYPH